MMLRARLEPELIQKLGVGSGTRFEGNQSHVGHFVDGVGT